MLLPTFYRFLIFAQRARAAFRACVRAGLKSARAKGKRLGRPPVFVDSSKIAALRSQGRSWAEIVAETGIGKGTAQRAFAGLPKIGQTFSSQVDSF